MLNFFIEVLHRIRYVYYWIARPKTYGVRGIILNKQNEFLLVKHRYLRGWYLLGGGVGCNESSEDALKREVMEEIGLRNLSIEKKFATYTSEKEYKRDTIDLFVGKVLEDGPLKLSLELQEARFFPKSGLPDDLSSATRRRLDEYVQGTAPDLVW